jgi:hypothetical protein
MSALLIATWILIGFAAGAVLGTEAGPLFGFRNMEGSSAIFGMLFCGPAGAALGAFAAVAFVRKHKGDTRLKGRTVGGSWLVIALLVAGGFLFEILTNDRIDNPPTLMFEIRMPLGVAAPAKTADVSGNLRSKGDDGSSLSFYDGLWQGRDGDRDVMKGSVSMWRRTTDRIVVFRVGDGPAHLFKVTALAMPVNNEVFSAWSSTDLIEEGKTTKVTTRKPLAGEALDFRYRVNK